MTHTRKALIDPELYTEDSSMSAAKRMDKSVARVGVSKWLDCRCYIWITCYKRICSFTSIKGPDGKGYVTLTQTTTTMDVMNY